ncbi:MAG TPA: hypothetical protein GX513_00825, partial [Firmicutes bacterium]|nr:hypothetical protein [Bacillota bacterium]
PATAEEAAEVAAREGSVPVAGGTDLILFLKKERVSARTVVSLRRIDEFRRVEMVPGGLFIGATVTWAEILASDLVRDQAEILAKAARVLGSPQIRNVATVGGNMCTAAPSADGAPALLVLEAMVHLVGLYGRRQVPIADFFLAPFRTVCTDSKELVAGVTIPRASLHLRGCYLKHSVRNSMDLSMLGVAALVKVGPGGEVEEGRIALGTAGPTPLRARSAERVLQGQRPDQSLLAAVAEAAAADSRPRSSWRASEEYRRHLVRVLTKRALEACLLAAS